MPNQNAEAFYERGGPMLWGRISVIFRKGTLPSLVRQLTPQARQEEVSRLPKATILDHCIHYRISDGCAVVRLESACDANATEALARLVNSSLIESKNLVIDLSRCEYIETPGYRWMVKQLRLMESAGKKLIVAGMLPPVARMFKLLHFDKMIPSTGNVTEALIIAESRNKNHIAA